MFDSIMVDYENLNAFRNWLSKNTKPLKVDIGCGKDEFIIQAAASEKESRFLGIENNGHMIWRLEKKVRRSGLKNIHLLPYDAHYCLDKLIGPQKVTCFYIQFPDPWPKKRHQKRRVLNTVFIEKMCQSLVPEGEIFFATDVDFLALEVQSLLETFQGLKNLKGPYEWFANRDHPWQTLYEKKFLQLNKPIYYLKYFKPKISLNYRNERV